MEQNQLDALYCVLGELYFQHRTLERRAIDELGQIRKDFEKELLMKNSQIEELLAKSEK